MKVTYICDFKFSIKGDDIYSNQAYGDAFWEKYLDVFDEIHIVGASAKRSKGDSKVVLLTNPAISVELCPSIERPEDIIKNERKVKKQLNDIIRNADCLIIKPALRKGIMAIRIAKKYNIPYMIELTGDVNSSLGTEKSNLRKIYAPILYRQIKKAIRDCKFGLYVTNEFLQRLYPIEGKMCGCTDTVIPYIDKRILDKRKERISKYEEGYRYKIGIIGTYKNNRKGIDTAIKALSLIHNKEYELHVLGNGVDKDKEQWFSLAQEYSMHNILYFDTPVVGVENVFKWIDEIDILLLPSRSEGLPRCIIEGMSRGCPCIVSNAGGLPELISEEYRHDPEDYATLSKKILLMTENKKIMLEQADQNFMKSYNYTFERLKEKRNDFLNEYKCYVLEKRS